jgi:hypothetical protein
MICQQGSNDKEQPTLENSNHLVSDIASQTPECLSVDQELDMDPVHMPSRQSRNSINEHCGAT